MSSVHAVIGGESFTGVGHGVSPHAYAAAHTMLACTEAKEQCTPATLLIGNTSAGQAQLGSVRTLLKHSQRSFTRTHTGREMAKQGLSRDNHQPQNASHAHADRHARAAGLTDCAVHGRSGMRRHRREPRSLRTSHKPPRCAWQATQCTSQHLGPDGTLPVPTTISTRGMRANSPRRRATDAVARRESGGCRVSLSLACASCKNPAGGPVQYKRVWLGIRFSLLGPESWGPTPAGVLNCTHSCPPVLGAAYMNIQACQHPRPPVRAPWHTAHVFPGSTPRGNLCQDAARHIQYTALSQFCCSCVWRGVCYHHTRLHIDKPWCHLAPS